MQIYNKERYRNFKNMENGGDIIITTVGTYGNVAYVGETHSFRSCRINTAE